MRRAGTPAWVAQHAVGLVIAQVALARLLPGGEPLISVLPWLFLAALHAAWTAPRVTGLVQGAVVLLTALLSGGLELFAASRAPHSGHGGLGLALDVALYIGLVGAIGAWAGRSVRRGPPSAADAAGDAGT